MHAKHECEIFGCPRIGETYRITGSHVEKYLKREKQYIVLESHVHDPAGRLLLKQRSTHIRALKPGVAKSTPGPAADAAAVPPAEVGCAEAPADLRPGVEMRPLTKTLNQDHPTVFAGTGWPNLHNAPEIAKGA